MQRHNVHLSFPALLPAAPPLPLQPLQRAAPEDVELGKPLAAQGLEAMEALRLVVRQDHVSAVQIACGVRKVGGGERQAHSCMRGVSHTGGHSGGWALRSVAEMSDLDWVACLPAAAVAHAAGAPCGGGMALVPLS